MSIADKAVVASAQRISRRRLFRNVSGACLGATVATATFARRSPASHCSSSSYEGPCGPAPLCASWRCDGGGSSCNASAGSTFARYGSGQQPCDKPDGSLYTNCWCHGSGGIRCCDCCVYNPGCKDYRCIGTWCGQDDWKCICRGTWGSCP